jgi:hypothetical protein
VKNKLHFIIIKRIISYIWHFNRRSLEAGGVMKSNKKIHKYGQARSDGGDARVQLDRCSGKLALTYRGIDSSYVHVKVSKSCV